MRASATTLVATVAVLVTVSCKANKGTFLLVNKASEPIANASVTICGQVIELKDIQPTKSVPGSYVVKSDSHYDIRVEFGSGRTLEKEMGYVTNGLDFQHEIVITDSDIRITEQKGP